MLPLPAKEKVISICDASIDITLKEITTLLLKKTSIILINHFPKNDCYMPNRIWYLFVMHAYLSDPLHSKFFNSKWMESPRVGFEPMTSQLIADRSTTELLRNHRRLSQSVHFVQPKTNMSLKFPVQPHLSFWFHFMPQSGSIS